MSNVIFFPTALNEEQLSANEIADRLLKVVTDTHQNEATARFWIANYLMHIEHRVIEDNAFSIDDITDCIIDDRSDVLEVADRILHLD